jgi:hypothetical protein
MFPVMRFFALPDDHEILGATNNRACWGKPADDSHIRLSCEERSGSGGSRSDKDQPHIKSLLLEETNFLGDPHRCH